MRGALIVAGAALVGLLLYMAVSARSAPAAARPELPPGEPILPFPGAAALPANVQELVPQGGGNKIPKSPGMPNKTASAPTASASAATDGVLASMAPPSPAPIYGKDPETGITDTSLSRRGITTGITGSPDAQGWWNGWGRIGNIASGQFFTVAQKGATQGQAPSYQDWLDADRRKLQRG